MAEKKSKPRKSMEEYGFKPVLLYLPQEQFEALRHYCFDKRLKFTPVIRDLLADKLRKEGYLKKESKA